MLGNIENIIAFYYQVVESLVYAMSLFYYLIAKKETRWRIFDCLCLCDKRETLNPKFRVEYLIILS